jgi:hypothetical protein
VQLGVPAAISFERGPGRVEAKAVDLDHQLGLSPQEVDPMAGHQLVHRGRRQACLADEGEKPLLSLRSRQRGLRAAGEDLGDFSRAAPAVRAFNGGGQGGVSG